LANPLFEVINCPRCNKIFQKSNRNQCPDCTRELDAALARCLDYLRRNHKAFEEQIVEDTGVPASFIQTWIKDGRLLINDYPNLNFPCSSCVKPILKNKMCVDCLTRFTQDLNKLNERKAPHPQTQGGGFQIRQRFGRNS
jgi:predicted amidophosphoribosyltransferase